jgi:8-oxo-dGTP pyrophosphatase MutT (NUDIX family)
MRRSALAEQLARHRPSAPLERRHVQRMQALLRAQDPFARSHFRPGHFTASAFVLSPERDALLLIHHRKLDLWLQPGGHVEAEDEDLIAAARREVLEEVGIPALKLLRPGIFDVDIHAIPARPDEPAHEHFDVRFLFSASARTLAAGEEIVAARWVPLPEVESVHSDHSVLRAVRKLSVAGTS